MKLNERVDELKDDLISSTQKIVHIKSVQGEPKAGMPYGEGPYNALKCALEISKGLGFKTVNMDGQIGYAEYGEGEDYVAVLGHLDIVPEGDGWKYPPYGAEIHDGKMYGRGTLDDKGATMAALYGLKAIKDLNLPLSKRVRIIFGTNEETGSKEVEYYMKREKAPVSGFTPDAEYPIIFAEKGITSFDIVKDLKKRGCGDIVVKSIKGGLRSNMVPDYCEALVEVKDIQKTTKFIEEYAKKTGFEIKAATNGNTISIKSYGVGAHGSTPELGKNAVMQMMDLLGELPIEEGDLKDYIDFVNKHIGFETDGKSFNVNLEDKESGKLSFNVGVITMDTNQIRMTLNLRYPVTFTFDDMMNPFNDMLKGSGIRTENIENQNPLYFPVDHPLIKTLQKVYAEQTGKEAKLLAIGGGTYAKEMPNIVAFGPILPGKPDLDHQVNEYMEVEDIIANAKMYAHAIYELAK